MNRLTSRSGIGITLLLLATGSASALDRQQEQLRERIEELAIDPYIGDVALAGVPLLTELYTRRDLRLAWTEPGRIDELLEVVAAVGGVGLDPDDYLVEPLGRLAAEAGRPNPPDASVRIDLDLLATESLARLAYHLRFGKVDPADLDSDWNLSRSVGGNDPVERIGSAIASSDPLAALLADRIRYLPPYDAMKAWLAKYREMARGGGWPRVPAGPVLKPGMNDPRVPAMRRRLKATGELDRSASDGELFDEALERAVIVFQRRHRLDDDGIVGRQTLDALNVSVEDRIGRIRVNLERVRWIYRDVEDSFLIVNIAGFEVFLIRDGEIAWRSPAQVGKPYRRTPVFKATMKYIVLNPTWTVPPTILAKDVLPAVQRDPGYLRRKNMNVVDSGGRVVDASTIDWSSVTPQNFGYAFRQEPGPNNALGRVKFIFPNSHFVFLHDTPSKALFERTDRAFSSGCIRVKNPFELAELLLENPDAWNQERIADVIASGETQTVFLPEPMTVMLLYWTVVIDAESEAIHFLKDVYDRDRRVLEALDEEFVFRPPDDLPDWAP